MDIARVVVHTDGYKGAMSEELDPITQELGRDEVTEPGGQLLILSDHGGDVGQACDQSDAEYWWGKSDNDVGEGAV